MGHSQKNILFIWATCKVGLRDTFSSGHSVLSEQGAVLIGHLAKWPPCKVDFLLSGHLFSETNLGTPIREHPFWVHPVK